jgi:hypothetical protein
MAMIPAHSIGTFQSGISGIGCGDSFGIIHGI